MLVVNQLKFKILLIIIINKLLSQLQITKAKGGSRMIQQSPDHLAILQKTINERIQAEIAKTLTTQLMKQIKINQIYEQQQLMAINNDDIMIHLVNQYNETQQLYNTRLLIQQNNFNQLMNKKQQQNTSKFIKLQSKYELQILKYSQKILGLQNVIQLQQKQLQQKQHKILQYGNNILNLQAQIQKYQYQLYSKNIIISNYIKDIQSALTQSQFIKEVFGNKSNQIQLFEKQMEIFMASFKIDNQRVMKEQSIALISSNLYNFIQSNKNEGIKDEQHEINKPLQIQPNNQHDSEDTQIILSLISESKQRHSKLITHIKQLLAYIKQQKRSYENLSHKYAQFLKQTQTKIQQYKTKLKQQQNKIKDVINNNKQLTTQLKNKQNQNIKLLQKFQLNLQRQRTNTQQSQNKMQLLNKQLLIKQQIAQSLQQQLKQQQNKYNKHLQSLTIQIQSLKQSISTLKNVFKSQHQGQQQYQSFDCTIVQQMIDKTYQIRVDNCRMKDNIDELQNTCEDKKKLVEEMENVVKSTHEENQKLKQQIKQYQQKLQKQQKNNTTITKRYYQLQQQHLTTSQTLQHQCQTYLHKLKTLQKQLTDLQQNKMIQQLQTCENILTTQKLQIYKLQISVLQQIINKKKIITVQKYVQVEIQLVDCQWKYFYDEEDISAMMKKGNQTNRCRYGGKYITKGGNQSIGKLVNVYKRKKQGSLYTKNKCQELQLQNINKTCKIRSDSNQNLTHKSQIQIQQMNQIINYMVNFAKGYTRNGIRRHCWLASRGEQYLLKIQNPKNIRQKYSNFERIRSLSEKNEIYKQLLKDYEKIINHYFGIYQLVSCERQQTWESSNKQNIWLYEQNSMCTTKVTDSISLKSNQM